MEFQIKEIDVVTETAKATSEIGIEELSDLQLALVGGGIGDVMPH